MSRRYLPSSSSQRAFVYQYSSDNTYQAPVLPQSHTYCNPLNTKYCYDPTETCTESSCHNSYEYQHIKEPKTTDCMFSDSDASSLKQCDELFNKRFSNGQSSFSKTSIKKVHPTHERISSNQTATGTVSLPRRLVVSQLSDRPRSALSAASPVVDGCGGHCQTFENVCYYFLQVAFTMGILIGISLSIAGAVLRKSAARNLQVLVYIGAMLSVVSFVLLYIQCIARYNARKRKKVIRSVVREPIALVTLQGINNQQPTTVLQQRQPLMDFRSSKRRCETNLKQQHTSTQLDQQGVPWWRRKEFH